MKLLAIETSTDVCSVALLDEGILIGEEGVVSRRRHSESLVPTIENLLLRCDTQLSNINAIAVGRGPGSFTGVRVGLSTVKALALGTDTVVVGVSSLAALSLNGLQHAGLICAVIQAGRGEIYAALYTHRLNYMGQVESICRMDGALLSPEDLVKKLRVLHQECDSRDPILMVGAPDLRKLFGQDDLLKWIPSSMSSPRGVFVGMLALTRIHLGDIKESSAELAPTYIRLSQAEVNLRKKLKDASMV